MMKKKIVRILVRKNQGPRKIKMGPTIRMMMGIHLEKIVVRSGSPVREEPLPQVPPTILSIEATTVPIVKL